MTTTRNRLAEIIGAHASHAHRYEAADAILAALPDLVKPLVWRDYRRRVMMTLGVEL